MLLSPLRDERMSFTMNNKSFRKLRVFFVFIEFAFNSYLQTNFSLIWIVVGITTCWGLHFYNFRKSYRKVIVKLWTRRHSSSEKKIVIKYILRNKLWIMGSLFKLMIVLILIFYPNWCTIVRCGKICIHRGDVIPIEWIMLCIKSFPHCSWQTTWFSVWCQDDVKIRGITYSFSEPHWKSQGKRLSLPLPVIKFSKKRIQPLKYFSEKVFRITNI